jgi:hypothetical protein
MKIAFLSQALFLALVASSANAQLSNLFGPDNYEECVLENMEGVSSDLAARMIADSCRSKFPAIERERGKPLNLSIDYSY